MADYNPWLHSQKSNSVPDSSPWLSFIYNKQESRQSQFAAITRENAEIAKELVGEVQRLSDAKRHGEARKLLATIKRILENNSKLQSLVVEILREKQ